MFTTILIALDNEQRLGQAGAHQAHDSHLANGIGWAAFEGDTQVLIELSPDDDIALATIERMEAICDNLASAVRLRQQERERGANAHLGAGASVEAYRG